MSYGRLKIYSDAKEITAANVVDEVNKAYSVHCINYQFVCRFLFYSILFSTISLIDLTMEFSGMVPRRNVRG